MTRKLRVTASATGDWDYWRTVSRWYEASLSAAGMAQLLGVKETSIRQMTARQPIGFPPPIKRGWRNEWSLAQAYEYLRTQRPKLSGLVPRLFPLLDAERLSPAMFIAAEALSFRHDGRFGRLGRPANVVAHYWQPADGGPPVAVLFPVDTGPSSRESAADIALLAAHKLAPLGYTTVAVVTDDERPLHDSARQAAVVVAEVSEATVCPVCPPGGELRPDPRRTDSDAVLYEVGWFDVAFLLQTDLPWWPVALRNRESILEWFPNRPISPVSPVGDCYAPGLLPRIARAAQQERSAGIERLTALLDRADRRIQAAIYPHGAGTPDLPGGSVPAPGIVQAATAAFTASEIPAPLAGSEVGWLLRQRYPDAAPPTAHASVASLTALQEVLDTVGTPVSARGAPGPLATEWFNRLEPADHLTLGHVYVRTVGSAAPGIRSDELLVDPLNPLTWAVRGADGQLVYSVGTRLPARGELREFERGASLWAGSDFMRDSDGIVWPLPSISRPGLSDALASTLTVLLRSGVSVDLAEQTAPQRINPAMRRLSARPGPWSASASELQAALSTAEPPSAISNSHGRSPRVTNVAEHHI
jgi:hypothetical protein